MRLAWARRGRRGSRPPLTPEARYAKMRLDYELGRHSRTGRQGQARRVKEPIMATTGCTQLPLVVRRSVAVRHLVAVPVGQAILWMSQSAVGSTKASGELCRPSSGG
jgi:hypothetical protein